MKCCASSFLLACALQWMSPAVAAKDTHDIAVQGNSRTQTFYIKKLTGECLENIGLQLGDPSLPPALRQCLLNSRLFSEVEVNVERSAKITVRIDERWTLIPLPFFQISSSGETSVGGFLLETNFLGIGDTLGFGGIYATRGTSLFLYLSDKSLFGPSIGGALGLRREANTVELVPGKKRKDGFFEVAKEAGVANSIRSGDFQYQATLSRVVSTYSTVGAFEKPPDNGSTRILMEAKYSKTAYRVYINQGYTAQMSILKELVRSDHNTLFTLADARYFFEFPVFGNHAAQVMLRAGMLFNGNKSDAPRFGSARGFRGFDKATLWPRQYTVVSSNYHFPLVDSPMGVLTIGPFLDLGKMTLVDGSTDVSYGTFGVSTAYFLKQVAVSGLGFDAGYNSARASPFLGLSIGISL